MKAFLLDKPAFSQHTLASRLPPEVKRDVEEAEGVGQTNWNDGVTGDF